ncbi:MAG: 50S ribosomal protein L29 [Gemmatimonadetes bacterium]|nr:50S ribosomal protein L29 [Gemmatimonadota bacterium]MBT8404158.1 50S ribosomal protein L29 [Gemmatimonadota bacterium]NNF38097.1 50S ribosomal protein L29 [Gemmatimonadota bacterium]
MKAEDIRDWEDTEIEARLGELKEEQFRLRFRNATMELENPRILGDIKRDIARLKTIIRERELAGNE